MDFSPLHDITDPDFRTLPSTRGAKSAARLSSLTGALSLLAAAPVIIAAASLRSLASFASFAFRRAIRCLAICSSRSFSKTRSFSIRLNFSFSRRTRSIRSCSSFAFRCLSFSSCSSWSLMASWRSRSSLSFSSRSYRKHSIQWISHFQSKEELVKMNKIETKHENDIKDKTMQAIRHWKSSPSDQETTTEYYHRTPPPQNTTVRLTKGNIDDSLWEHCVLLPATSLQCYLMQALINGSQSSQPTKHCMTRSCDLKWEGESRAHTL